MHKTPAELHSVPAPLAAASRAEERQPSLGFTLNGSTSLEAVAQFYGLKVPGLEPGMTVADYLRRSCYGNPRPGYRIALGGAELAVQDIEEGSVRKVALRFLPMRPHPPRQPRPVGSARGRDASASRGAGRLAEMADPPR